jgi:hypothetical protein
MAQLYPRALGSLSAASYDSHGCGGGIPSRLHTGKVYLYVWPGHGPHRKNRFRQLFYCRVLVCFGYHMTATDPSPSKRVLL